MLPRRPNNYSLQVIEQGCTRPETAAALVSCGVIDTLLSLHTLSVASSSFSSHVAVTWVTLAMRTIAQHAQEEIINRLLPAVGRAALKMPALAEEAERRRKQGLSSLSEEMTQSLTGMTYLLGVLVVIARAVPLSAWPELMVELYRGLCSMQRCAAIAVYY